MNCHKMLEGVEFVMKLFLCQLLRLKTRDNVQEDLSRGSHSLTSVLQSRSIPFEIGVNLASPKPPAMNKLQCPRCKTSLESMTMIGVTIDICNTCNGCWLDQDESSALTRSRGNKALNIKLVNCKPSQLTCPKCVSKSMEEGQHAQKDTLILDECKDCHGVWLDRGELTALLTIKQ